jgi:hypothetical protein
LAELAPLRQHPELKKSRPPLSSPVESGPRELGVDPARRKGSRYASLELIGGLNDIPIQMYLQSQANKFENQKGRGFSLSSIARMFGILQECSLAGIMFLVKRKHACFCGLPVRL